MLTPRPRDEGTGYEMRAPVIKSDLVEVGRGTPMGELLRRYWHPIGLTKDAGGTPRKIRALGEDLILFRDGQGRPGLLHARCAHRGTTLYYGKVEAAGIRCCYHGWLFDAEGHCLEQPCEPQGGQFKDKVRQPWYPAEEKYGLIFAYMGPPERKPVLPTYECLEVMDAGEFVEADNSIHRQRRAGDRSLQLAAALRKRRRSVSCAGAARLVQRRAIHHRHGGDAERHL